MKATPATERQDSKSQESRRQKTELDSRYGKIGISAVAAAVRHKGEQHEQQQRVAKGPRLTPYDRD
jgi:hypothetical protein